MSVVCLWFRNDLRLHDNTLLQHALDLLRSGTVTKVLPVYFWDPRIFNGHMKSCPKTGPFRQKFLRESVLDLKKSFRDIGSDLIVVQGRPEAEMKKLLPPGSIVLTQEEVTHEEIKVDRAVQEAGFQLEKIWGCTMYHRDDLPFKVANLPAPFTSFRQVVERQCKIRRTVPTPGPGSMPCADVPEELRDAVPPEVECHVDPRGVMAFQGGETAALKRLEYYVWSDKVAKYKETRNGMIGADYSTKFAPWLACGTLSPRTIYHEIKKYESMKVSNPSTYWVIFELTWRDYFHFFGQQHGRKMFYPGGVVDRVPQWKDDDAALERWREGKTGWPLVDANMRELKATGFMSNRGRQIVASFLCFDLKLDWRKGAEWFEYLLLDYDVCANWGNWVAAAGLTGGRINRFNVTKQGRDYDREGKYIKLWCPELKDIPAEQLHEPWRMDSRSYSPAKPREKEPERSTKKSRWTQKDKGQKRITDFFAK